MRSVASRFRVLLCCSFSFALVLCVFCRDAVVGCGGLLRSVCCRGLLNVAVEYFCLRCICFFEMIGVAIARNVSLFKDTL